MLDRDIAVFYGVETKRLNEKVKRNPKRFAGEDFMFQLTPEEFEQVRLRSQFATLNKGRGTHSKYLPHAFTLLGVSMLSSVLESDSAIEANRRIMRAFVTFHQLKSLPLTDAYNELKHEIDNLKEEVNEILADQNDINEMTNNRKTKFIWEMMGKSTVATGGKAGTFRVKVTLLQVNGRTVLLLAAAAANIDGGRC